MKLVVIAALVIAQVPLLLWSDNTSENLLKLPCLSQVVVVTWPSLNPTKVGGSEILAEFERSKNSNYVPRINSNDLKSFVEEKCGSVIEIELQQQTSLDQDQELKQKLRSLNLQDYIIMLTVFVNINILGFSRVFNA